ncbi:hypothetical protein KBC04_02720 [Candidatus Babeliales bacterium]|nr:hypothetical protein [Candidatus Babeliales bacterium]MBP9844034.1 hypothetical protein [Candidatus Babeliales bacterium]
MNIKQYKKFEFQIALQVEFQIVRYSLLERKSSYDYPISYIEIFFSDGFPYVNRYGVKDFIKERTEGMMFERIELHIDNEHNVAYIHEPIDFSRSDITPEVHQLIENDDIVKLCKMGFLGYTVMTKDNLFHLLLLWGEFVDKKAPYILIYLDDKDYYDTLSFDSKESMDKFVAEHTKKETN